MNEWMSEVKHVCSCELACKLNVWFLILDASFFRLTFQLTFRMPFATQPLFATPIYHLFNVQHPITTCSAFTLISPNLLFWLEFAHTIILTRIRPRYSSLIVPTMVRPFQLWFAHSNCNLSTIITLTILTLIYPPWLLWLRFAHPNYSDYSCPPWL